jgi:hypothetical protein
VLFDFAIWPAASGAKWTRPLSDGDRPTTDANSLHRVEKRRVRAQNQFYLSHRDAEAINLAFFHPPAAAAIANLAASRN